MHPFTKVASVAAAVVVAAAIGLMTFAPSSPGSPSPSPTAVPSLAPAVPPTLPVLVESGLIDPGPYLVRSHTQTPFQVTVPVGWTLDLGMLHKGDFYDGETAAAVLLRPWIVTHVYGDACHWQGAKELVGPTKADLVAALSAQTGRDVDGPVDVELGGLAATRFVLSVPADGPTSACDDGYRRPWPDTGGGEEIGPPMFAGSITTIYVVETAGKATAIQAARYETSAAGDVAELQAVLDSIIFLP